MNAIDFRACNSQFKSGHMAKIIENYQYDDRYKGESGSTHFSSIKSTFSAENLRY